MPQCYIFKCYLVYCGAYIQAGGCWMDALQLTLRCSGLLLRTMHKVICKKFFNKCKNKFGIFFFFNINIILILILIFSSFH